MATRELLHPADAEITKEEDAVEEPLVGRLLSGKWRVDRLIGKGGVASVYEATHRNGRRAAIKVLSPDFAGNRRMRGRFQREGYLANRVGHPGAVAILDDDVSGDHAYLVMELLDGITLDALRVARGGRLPLRETLWVGIELLDVLHAAHTRGILHRDVKPGNVFVTRGRELKLLDFGIASLREGPDTQGITETGMVLGTPGFMAPEQARGRLDEVGPATDVYSVGATLFRLLSGRLVHEGGTSSELQIAVATTDARPLASVSSEIPRDVCRIIDRALHRDAAVRFGSAEAMKQALSEVAARLGIAGVPPVLPNGERPPDSFGEPTSASHITEARSRPGRRGLMLAAAATAVTAAIGYREWLRTQAPEPNAEPHATSVPAKVRTEPTVTAQPTSAPVTPVPPPSPQALAPRSSVAPKLTIPPPAGAPRTAAPSRARPKPAPSATVATSARPPVELLKQRL
jgi:serine/threonine protein kinase